MPQRVRGSAGLPYHPPEPLITCPPPTHTHYEMCEGGGDVRPQFTAQCAKHGRAAPNRLSIVSTIQMVGSEGHSRENQRAHFPILLSRPLLSLSRHLSYNKRYSQLSEAGRPSAETSAPAMENRAPEAPAPAEAWHCKRINRCSCKDELTGHESWQDPTCTAAASRRASGGQASSAVPSSVPVQPHRVADTCAGHLPCRQPVPGQHASA